MKTFLAAFLGVLCAAAVIYLVVVGKQRLDRRAEIEKLRSESLAVAASCKDLSLDELKEIGAALRHNEDLIQQLEGDSRDWYQDNVFDNQLVAAGCFRDFYSAPSAVVEQKGPRASRKQPKRH